jgi:hypothetical protein
MSRSNYSDSLDEWDLIRWRGQVASATRGKRGQRLLIDLVAALDALPEKVLIAEELVNSDGDYCALGAVGARRGIDMSRLDPEESESVAEAFDIADPLAREITYINDECGNYGETPQQRWLRVREWALQQIRPVPVEGAEQ